MVICYWSSCREQAVLFCAVWSEFPQFAQVVVIVENTEKAALALCSVVRFSPSMRGL